MKNIYIAPEVFVREVDKTDVITTSGAMDLPIVPIDGERAEW